MQEAFGVLQCIVDRSTTSIHIVVDVLDACGNRPCLVEARKYTQLESRAPPPFPINKEKHLAKRKCYWWFHSVTIAESRETVNFFL